MLRDFAHYVDQVVREQAARLALEDQQHGAAADIPQSKYLEQIADSLGITTTHLYRYMCGAASPSVAMVRDLSRVCQTKLLVAWQCRGVGLSYYQRSVRPAEPRDLVEMVSHELRDTSQVAHDVLEDLADGSISINERDRLVPEIDDAIDSLQALKDQAIAVTVDPTKPADAPRVRNLRTA
jgi:transcriptional regulator with XRE-family HTH domain